MVTHMSGVPYFVPSHTQLSRVLPISQFDCHEIQHRSHSEVTKFVHNAVSRISTGYLCGLCSVDMSSTSENQGNRTVDNKFKENILRALNAMRQQNSLCNVILRVSGTINFSAHRCVLSASSSYFQALFTDDFLEKQSDVVELKEIGASAMEKVLEFIYTGEVEIDLASAQDLVMAADYLNIPALKLNASAVLETSIDVSNCLSLQQFSTKYDCVRLKESCAFFINQNFSQVAKSEGFEALSFESLIDLFRRDELSVVNESEVLHSAISWVKYDLHAREKLLPDVLKHVRFAHIPKSHLVDIVNSETLLQRNAICVDLLPNNPAGTTSIYALGASQTPRTGPLEIVVILTGGKSVSRYGLQKNFLAFRPSRDSWVTLPDLHLPRHSHGVAVCEGSLYITGGVCGNIAAHHHVCRFSPRRNKWRCDVSDLPYPVSCSAVVSLQNKLFVIGGRDKCNNTLTKTQCYNPRRNQWDCVADMNIPRESHCATVLNDAIYVISGDKLNFQSSEFYDVSTKKWNLLPDMTLPRQRPAAQAIGGKIMVVGGFQGANYKMHTTCEIFDPKQNLWSLVSGLVVPRAGCGITCVESHVYVFGGSNGRSVLNTLDSVERYSAEENEWKKVSVIPETVITPQVAVIRMPGKYLV